MTNEVDVNNVAFIESADDAHTHHDASCPHNIIMSEQDEDLINKESQFNNCEGNEKQKHPHASTRVDLFERSDDSGGMHTAQHTRINYSVPTIRHKCAVWTIEATLFLLKSYESQLEILETPKKKTRVWIAIAKNLKEHNIEVTPDQVRWKINALAKKYKQCIDSGEHDKFRFFKDMDNIYSQYNVECTDFSIIHAERFDRNNIDMLKNPTNNLSTKPEGKTFIELRKIRLANRIEADRSRSKISLEKQWIEYLKRKESQKKWRDEIFERNLKLKQEELRLRKQELEMKEALELRRIELKEKEQEEMLSIEREKCELLKKIFSQENVNYNLNN